MCLLAIDIGNSRIKVGVFKNKKIIRFFTLLTPRSKESNRYEQIISQFINKNKKKVHSIVISSVVPSINKCFQKISEKYFHLKPFWVNYYTAGLKVRYSHPEKLGSDRLVNSLAGYHLFGGPLIIIDFGTAITFNCVNSKGEFIGGLILPGLETAVKSLAQNTGQLPAVKLKPAKKIIGQSTQECINSGIFYGYLSMIDGLVNRLKTKIKSLEKSKVIVTGGSAKLVVHYLKSVNKIVPDLTLQGLRIIGERVIDCKK